MKSFCVVTIKLNTLTDVPYQMTVGGAFVYVCETCERGRVKDFEQLSHVYNEVHYNAVYITLTRRFRINHMDQRIAK